MARRSITREQREELLVTFLRGDTARAEALALHLGLAPNYTWKLALARGLVPRTGKRWPLDIRESAA